VKDFRSERCGVTHRCRCASAGISPVRGTSKAGSRQGTRNVSIGNFQFQLDIFV
jgi:hypothetical protein